VPVTADRTQPSTRPDTHPVGRSWIRPFHALLLGGTLSLFLGALLSDIAYYRSYEIQWNNFASWLIAGALAVGVLVLLSAIVDLARAAWRGRPAVYFVLLLVAWVAGFVNALVHAKDAWASMPAGLVLSAIVFVLACVAAWLGFSALRTGEVR